MSITTVDGLIAGFQPAQYFFKAFSTAAIQRTYSSWPMAGNPCAGVYDTTLNGAALSGPITGQIPFTNPSSGNSYLTRFMMASSIGYAAVQLCDRLWHNGGFTITSTSAQNITSPTWPARDNNGATNGEGVFLAMEVSATVGAGSPTITASYTNSAGTSGRTATANIETVASSATTGSFFRFGLQAGDLGVRSVQSITLSASWVSGTMNLVAYRPIYVGAAGPGCGVVGSGVLESGMSRIYDNSVMFFTHYDNGGSGAFRVVGSVQWAQG